MRHSLSLVFAAIAAYALPASEIAKRAVDPSTLANLNFYEQYAAAAYCPSNNQPGSPPKITCSAGNCPQVQSSDANSIVEFQNLGPADATGFVALDKTHKTIIISYRGSHSVLNWLGNLNFAQVPAPQLCTGCKVHEGFLHSWLATRSLVTNAVNDALAQNPGFSVVAVGHSLGGAIATLAAAELRAQGRSVGLYTYGSPMVGNVAFARSVSAGVSGPTYRVTHLADAVPKLPGYWPLGYAHTYPEYWIGSGNGVAVGTGDVYAVNVGNPQGLQGDGGLFPWPDVSNHLWYFGSISACAPAGWELVRRGIDGDVDGNVDVDGDVIVVGGDEEEVI